MKNYPYLHTKNKQKKQKKKKKGDPRMLRNRKPDCRPN